MIGTHQVCLRPVGAGTTLPSDYIIHIPHEQAMVFGITADSFRCCCRTGIDGIRAPTPPLPETFIGTGRGSQKNGDVRKTVAQQFHKFIHLIVVHIYIITPVMAFIGSERENQAIRFQGSDFVIRSGWVNVRQVAPLTAFINIRNGTKGFLPNGHRWFGDRYVHARGYRQYERCGLYLRRVRHVPGGDVQRREPAEQCCQ